MPVSPLKEYTKISDLPRKQVKENDKIPINTKDSKIVQTSAIAFSDIREGIFFDTAPLTIEEGLSTVDDGEMFFVYENAAKFAVLQYVKISGQASPVVGVDGNQRRYPTYMSLQAGIEIPRETGYGQIGMVTSISRLREIKPKVTGQRIMLAGYRSDSNYGGGEFIGRTGSMTDDGGTYITSGFDWYWERIHPSDDEINLTAYGVLVGDDISDKLNSAILAAKRLGVTNVTIPCTRYDKSFVVSKRIDVDYTDGSVLFIRGAGGNKLGTTIKSKVPGPLFYFRRNNVTSKYFWTTGGIENLTIDADTSIRDNLLSSAIQISDTWSFIVDKIRITNFISGTGLYIRNETAWTEGTKISDLDIRNTTTGILFTRDTSRMKTDTRDGNTNSFFGTSIDQYSFQAGTGKPMTSAIQVGDEATGIASGDCVLYGSNIFFRYWAEGGGNNYGILVKKDGWVTEGKTVIIPDGIGLSPEGVFSGTPYKSIGVMKGGAYTNKTDVFPHQGKLTSLKVKDLALAMEANIYYEKSPTEHNALYKGRPLISPTGLKVYAYQSFSADEVKEGFKVGLFNLPVGSRLRVVLRYNRTNNPTGTRVSSYIVSVGGSGMYATVAPENIDILNVMSGNAVVASRPRLNDFVDSATSPRVVNPNTTQVNKDGFTTDSRNISVVIPADPSATDGFDLGVEVEWI